MKHYVIFCNSGCKVSVPHIEYFVQWPKYIGYNYFKIVTWSNSAHMLTVKDFLFKYSEPHWKNVIKIPTFGKKNVWHTILGELTCYSLV